MAARYMGAAAHGGQIACELDLALSVMNYWTSNSSSNSNGQSFEVLGCSCSIDNSPPHMMLTAAAAAVAGRGAVALGGGVCRLTDSTPSTPASQVGQEGRSTGSFTSSDSPRVFASAAADALLGHRQQQQQLYHTTSDASSSSCMTSSQLQTQQQQCQGVHLQQEVCLQQQQQQQQEQQHQQLYGLAEVPSYTAAVEVQRLGTFRFKGGALQQVQMANITHSHLSGRARFTPSEPPPGKGERVTRGTGVAAQAHVLLPALVQQYKARVPVHILQCPLTAAAAVAAAAGAAADTDCSAGRVGSLRTTSAPLQGSQSVKGSGVQPGRAECLVEGSGVSGFELVEVLGLRQKSHSFTCPDSPGLM